MAGQVQVGGVTVQTPDVNPLGSVLSGVATGADWAMKNYELNQKSASLQAEMEKSRIASMKAQHEINEKVWGRTKEIMTMPNSKFKKAKIEMLKVDLAQIGGQLHPINEALLQDPTYETDLATAALNIDSSDPVKRMQAIDVMRNTLGDEKMMTLLQGVNQEAGKDKRNMISAIATASEKGAQRDFQLGLKKMEIEAQAERDKSKQTADAAQEEKKLAQQEKLKDKELTSQEKRDATKLAAEVAKEKRETTTSVRKEANQLSTDYDRWNRVAKNIYDMAGDPKSTTGAKDAQIIKAFNQFNDTPAVREGEVKFQMEGAPLIERARALVGSWVEGTRLGPEQRQQIVQATKLLHAGAIKMQQEKMSPIVQQIKDQGLDPAKIFSPAMRKLMNIGGSQSSARPAGSGASSAAPAPATPAKPTAQAPAAGIGLTPVQIRAGKAFLQKVGNDANAMLARLAELETKLGRKLNSAERQALGLKGGQ